MKIGIVSDSHKKTGFLKDAIDRLKADGANFLIHAGDIVLKEGLELLKESSLPYKAVFGNNDARLYEYAKEYDIDLEPYYFHIENIKVKLMHHPYYMMNDADLIVCGHTHYFKAEIQNGTLYINPGEICARKKPVSEFVMVEKTQKGWSLRVYTKELLKNKTDYSAINKELFF